MTFPSRPWSGGALYKTAVIRRQQTVGRWSGLQTSVQVVDHDETGRSYLEWGGALNLGLLDNQIERLFGLRYVRAQSFLFPHGWMFKFTAYTKAGDPLVCWRRAARKTDLYAELRVCLLTCAVPWKKDPKRSPIDSSGFLL